MTKPAPARPIARIEAALPLLPWGEGVLALSLLFLIFSLI